MYQSGVMPTGYPYGYFEAKDLLRVSIYLTLVESNVLMFLVPSYRSLP